VVRRVGKWWYCGDSPCNQSVRIGRRVGIPRLAVRVPRDNSFRSPLRLIFSRASVGDCYRSMLVPVCSGAVPIAWCCGGGTVMVLVGLPVSGVTYPSPGVALSPQYAAGRHQNGPYSFRAWPFAIPDCGHVVCSLPLAVPPV